MNSRIVKFFKISFIPFSIFIFSFLIRYFYISKGPYHLDCLTLAINAQKTVLTHKLHYTHLHGFPVVSIMAAVFVFLNRLWGNADPVWAVNFMNVCMGALCVLMFFFFGRLIFNTKAAFFGSILFSLSPIFFGTSVYGNSHATCLFFVLTGFIFLLLSLRTERLTLLMVSAFAWGLAGAARIQDVIPLLGSILFLLLFRIKKDGQPQRFKRSTTKSLLIFFAIMGTTILAFYFPVLFVRKSYHVSALFNRVVLYNFAGLKLGYLQLAFGYLKNNFLLIGIVVALLSWFWTILKKTYLGIFLTLWFVLPFMAFSSLIIIIPRHLIICLAPIYLLQGALLDHFYQYKNKFFRIASIAIFLILTTFTFMRVEPFLYFRHNHKLLPDYYTWLNQRIPKNSRVIDIDSSAFYSYYTNLKDFKRPANNRHKYTPQEFASFKKSIDDLLETNIPVFITHYGLNAYDRHGYFKFFFKHYYDIEFIDENYVEDWHGGIFRRIIMWNGLYQIKLKSE